MQLFRCLAGVSEALRPRPPPLGKSGSADLKDGSSSSNSGVDVPTHDARVLCTQVSLDINVHIPCIGFIRIYIHTSVYIYVELRGFEGQLEQRYFRRRSSDARRAGTVYTGTSPPTHTHHPAHPHRSFYMYVPIELS